MEESEKFWETKREKAMQLIVSKGDQEQTEWGRWVKEEDKQIVEETSA